MSPSVEAGIQNIEAFVASTLQDVEKQVGESGKCLTAEQYCDIWQNLVGFAGYSQRVGSDLSQRLGAVLLTRSFPLGERRTNIADMISEKRRLPLELLTPEELGDILTKYRELSLVVDKAGEIEVERDPLSYDYHIGDDFNNGLGFLDSCVEFDLKKGGPRFSKKRAIFEQWLRDDITRT